MYEPAEPLPPLYASFTRRFRAVVLDAAVIAGVFVMLSLIGAASEPIPGSGRVIVGLMFTLLLYEPLMVWRRGATLGHQWSNLHVVARSGGHPGFLQSLARYGIKSMLGLPSFLVMLVTRRRQAAHDWLTRTTVQIRDPERAEPWQFHVDPGDRASRASLEIDAVPPTNAAT